MGILVGERICITHDLGLLNCAPSIVLIVVTIDSTVVSLESTKHIMYAMSIIVASIYRQSQSSWIDQQQMIPNLTNRNIVATGPCTA